jgi:hypothetical protein
MPDNHDSERRSSSPEPATFNGKQKPKLGLQTAALPTFATNALSFSMPSPDRLQYSNKESVKVNAGLWYSGGDGSDTASLLLSSAPAVDFDFSQIIVPIVAPAAKLSTAILVDRLLHPPPHAFVHGVVSIQWVIGVLGQQHIKFRHSDERYVLAVDSNLREEGVSLGMPALYMEWLCGDDEETSATEQALHLTAEFFENINSGEE